MTALLRVVALSVPGRLVRASFRGPVLATRPVEALPLPDSPRALIGLGCAPVRAGRARVPATR